jgi:hypothetical protein
LKEAGVPENNVDRRANVRFPLQLAVSYRTFNPAACSGSSPLKSVNISSNGLLFEDNGTLQPGQRVQVSLEWPARLDQRIPLNLVVEGRILRSGNGLAVLKIFKHEFKTRGSGHSGSENNEQNAVEQCLDADPVPDVLGLCTIPGR